VYQVGINKGTPVPVRIRTPDRPAHS